MPPVIPKPNETEEEKGGVVVDPVKDPEKVTVADVVEDDGPIKLDIATIGFYTGGVFGAIIIVLSVVFCVEKYRKKKKRITEIVEL